MSAVKARALGRGFERAAGMFRQQLLERVLERLPSVRRSQEHRGDRTVDIGGVERRVEDRRLGRVEAELAGVLELRRRATTWPGRGVGVRCC